jgi:predicted aspartyl protease
VDTAKVTLVAIMDGGYPTGEVGLDVSFNGKRRRLEVDTGASGLVLSKSAASGLGIVREDKIESAGVGDKGNVATSTAHVASVKIGKLEFRNCEVDILEKGSALDIDGLIGGDVFRKFLLTLDYPNKELRLEPLPKRPDEAKPEMESLNTEGGDDEEADVHDRYIAPEMKDWTNVYRFGHELLLPVRIGESKAKLFLVDTGADSMLISPDAAREVTKVKNNYDDHISGISGEVKKVYETGKFKIEFAHLYQKVDSMTSIDTTKLSHVTGIEVSGFMGAPILQRLTIHIDYRDDLIKFDYDPKKD